MSVGDRILLRKRSVIETVNDELKHICQIEHSRHRATNSFLMNLMAAPAVYRFFDKKQAIRFERELHSFQLVLFF